MNSWRRIFRSSSSAWELVRDLLGLLDQREDVAHAEDPARHPLRMEALELAELLTGRRIEDRLARHRPDRERGAAPGVAVELREQHPVEIDALGERLGDVDGILPGHRVQHQEDVVRLGLLADRRQLVHQLLVDVEPAGGVDDQDVVAGPARLSQRPRGDLGGRPLGSLLIDASARLPAHRDELIDRGGALGVAGRQGDALALAHEQLGELRAGRRLARALEAGHQDHRRARAREREVAARAAHQLGELLVDDLDHLLARVEAVEDARAQAALSDLRGELLDDLEVDVGLEQGEADLAHRAVDVRLGQLSPRANSGERLLQAI